MNLRIPAFAVLASCVVLGGCGKIAATIGKGIAHEADNAAAAASRSAARDEGHAAASAAVHGADDVYYGPNAEDEAAKSTTPVTDFVVDAGKEIGKELGENLVQDGLQSAIAGDNDDKN